MMATEFGIDELLKADGYVVVYDGRAATQKRTDQFSVSSEDRHFFVRYYRQVRSNRFTDKYAKVVYDLRRGLQSADDNLPFKRIALEMYRKGIDGRKIEQLRMESRS